MQLKCLLFHSKNNFTYRFISNQYDAFSSIDLNYDRPTIIQIASY